jgi:hypothetical protein
MALVFDAVKHEYWLDGHLVPSTTQILRESGLIRFDGIPPFILEAARTRGSAVHALVHYLNEDDLDWGSVDPAYRGYLDAWVACKNERQIVPLLCEHRIASRRHRVAGTLDLLCEIDGNGWLIDYATGDPEDVSKDFQTGSYLGLAYEWGILEDARLRDTLQLHHRWRRAAVRLRRTGKFSVTEYTDPRDYARFQTLAAAWHIRHERGAIVQPEDVAA